MPRTSAGLLIYRRRTGELEVLLGHPGGPFWARKDAGAWTIPKGGIEKGEEPLAAARREFAEETGWAPPEGEPLDLGEIRQRSGKRVRCFALEGDFDVATLKSNDHAMEHPPRSGRKIMVPELDRAGWFGLGEAARKINVGQVPLLERLAVALTIPWPPSGAAALQGEEPSLFTHGDPAPPPPPP